MDLITRKGPLFLLLSQEVEAVFKGIELGRKAEYEGVSRSSAQSEPELDLQCPTLPDN